MIETKSVKTLDDVALEECEKAKPTGDPVYWAKRSCTRCYGRGVIGKMTSLTTGNNTMVTNLLCDCANMRFGRWRKEWIANWKKEQSLTLKVEPTVNV